MKPSRQPAGRLRGRPALRLGFSDVRSEHRGTRRCCTLRSMSRDRVPRASYPTTQWTRIRSATEANTEARPALLNGILEKYRPAIHSQVFHYYRHMLPDGMDAEDVVQSFLCHVVLDRNLLSRADRQAGRLRDYLGASLKHHILDLHRCKKPPVLYVDVQFLAQHPTEGKAGALDSGWAITVLQQALHVTKTRLESRGLGLAWKIFKEHTLLPVIQGHPAPSYKQLARQHGISDVRASNLRTTATRALKKSIRQVIKTYGIAESEMETELINIAQTLRESASTLGGDIRG